MNGLFHRITPVSFAPHRRYAVAQCDDRIWDQKWTIHEGAVTCLKCLAL